MIMIVYPTITLVYSVHHKQTHTFADMMREVFYSQLTMLYNTPDIASPARGHVDHVTLVYPAGIILNSGQICLGGFYQQ